MQSISGSGAMPRQESRGQRPLVPAEQARVQGSALPPSAQDRPPRRRGSPEGSALWSAVEEKFFVPDNETIYRPDLFHVVRFSRFVVVQ